jgi:HlyD family secretion protein
MFSRRNLWIGLGAIVLALAAGGVYFWQQRQAAQQAAAAEMRTERVGRGTIAAVVSATGPLSPQAQVNLFFGASTPQTVAEVRVSLGDRVKPGDVLARLDTGDLELALDQAEQQLRTAQLALAQLKAPPRPEDIALAEANLRVAQAQVFQASQGTPQESLETARLNLVIAQNALDQLHRQMELLVEQGKYAEKKALEGQEKQLIENAKVADLRYQQAQQPPSPGRAGSALAAVEQAKVALEKLRRGADPDDLEIAELEVKQARASVELARNNLKAAQIVAPFEGVVAAVNVREGEVAAGALPAIVLVDVSQFYLDVSVDEVDVARVKPGQPVTITLDALPNELFSGTVDRIAPQATVTAGVVNYPVRITLASLEPRLRGGMTSIAEIVVQEAQNVVIVPNWAIRRDRASGQAFVSLLKNGTIEEVTVELGLRNESVSEVTRGVNEGDVVAVSTARQQFSFFGGQ